MSIYILYCGYIIYNCIIDLNGDGICDPIYDQPQILSIEDIPQDQGGRVVINFIRSLLDTDTLSLIEQETDEELRNEGYTVEVYNNNSWISSFTGFAYGADHYTFLVDTFYDSTASDSGYSSSRLS